MSNPVREWGDLRQDAITFDPMRKPVVLVPCGHLFEKATVERHFERIKTCPMCVRPVTSHIESSDVRNFLEKGDQLAAQNTQLTQEVEKLKAQIAELTLRAAQKADQAAVVALHARAPEAPARPQERVQVREDPSALKLAHEILCPGKTGDFVCNRQFSGLNPEECVKYPQVIQRMAFKNKAPGSLLSYIRVDVRKDGGVQIFLSSQYKKSFEQYLSIFNLSLDPKESTRTTTNDFGETVPMGVFTTRTPEELEWALSFIGSNNKLPEKEHRLLQQIVLGEQPRGAARRGVPNAEVKAPY